MVQVRWVRRDNFLNIHLQSDCYNVGSQHMVILSSIKDLLMKDHNMFSLSNKTFPFDYQNYSLYNGSNSQLSISHILISPTPENLL